MKSDFSHFINRRDLLIKKIKENYPEKKGIILFFAPFENERYRFRQDSTLYYFTGLEEPGMVFSIVFDGLTMIYLPNYSEPRNKWASSILYEAKKETVYGWGVNEIQYLGRPCKGYSIKASCIPEEYEYLIKVIKDHISSGTSIFMPYKNITIDQRLLVDSLVDLIPGFKDHIIDISDIIGNMRRKKSKFEIEKLYNAVDCTMAAHESIAQFIEPGKKEFEVQAIGEFIFTQSGGSASFPSIVASGSNSTTLHYTQNNGVMKKNDLVVVDIGAEIDYYCADLTRTYPVSGVFLKRQKEVYNIVLDAQRFIEEKAKPGIWLNNKENPKNSLHHLALDFFEKKGYGKYFTHGIGHFLGLDVHDVGDYKKPLQEGDVITIEPGLYIQEENIGIRIEDNYWIEKDGAICLSEDLPKDPNLIEELMTE